MMGKTITVSGVDGCGKTTLANTLTRKLCKKGYKVKHIVVFNYLLLKPVISFVRFFSGKSSFQKERPHKKEANVLLGIIFTTLAIGDYWFHYFFYIVPLKRKFAYVLCERYYYDLLLSARYHRLITNNQLMLARKFVPKPNKVFYIKVNPVELNKRNKEGFSFNFFDEQTAAYNSFFNRLNCITIENNRAIDVVVDTMLNYLQQKLTAVFMVSGIGPYKASGTFVLWNLIKNLAKSDISVTVITPIYKEVYTTWAEWAKNETTSDLKMIGVKGPRFLYNFFPLYHSIVQMQAAVRLWQYCFFNHIDIVHEFTSSPLVTIRSSILGSVLKIRIFVTLSTFNKTIFGSPRILNLLKSERIITTTPLILKNLREIGINNRKTVLVPLTVDIKKSKNVTKEKAKKILGLPADKVSVVYSGPITQDKGAYQFLNMVKKINRVANIHFCFVASRGQGEYGYKVLKERIILDFKEIENFTFTEGEIDKEVLFKASDIFILPQQNAHGTIMPVVTLIEAMKYGCVVVGSDTVGIVDILENNKTGFVYPRKNIEKLTNIIEYLASAENVRNKISEKAKNSEIFSETQVKDKYLKLYEKA